jgi:hemerythrin-like domain-containing protein
MLEEKAKQRILSEVIALPPLRMVLMHASDEHVSKAALLAAIKKIALQSITAKEDVEPQTVKKIIQYLENKS